MIFSLLPMPELPPPPPPPPPPPLLIGWSRKGKRRERGLIYGHREHEENAHRETNINGGRRRRRRRRSRPFDEEEEERVYECDVCCKRFPNGQMLGGHMRAHREMDSKGRIVKKKMKKIQDLDMISRPSSPPPPESAVSDVVAAVDGLEEEEERERKRAMGMEWEGLRLLVYRKMREKFEAMSESLLAEIEESREEIARVEEALQVLKKEMESI